MLVEKLKTLAGEAATIRPCFYTLDRQHIQDGRTTFVSLVIGEISHPLEPNTYLGIYHCQQYPGTHISPPDEETKNADLCARIVQAPNTPGADLDELFTTPFQEETDPYRLSITGSQRQFIREVAKQFVNGPVSIERVNAIFEAYEAALELHYRPPSLEDDWKDGGGNVPVCTP